MVHSATSKEAKHRPAAHSRTWERWLELLSIATVAIGVIVFGLLAFYVEVGKVGELDRRLLLALRNAVDLADPLGPSWVESMVRDFTAFGGVGALTFFMVVSAGGLALGGKRKTALLALLSVGGGLALEITLKALFHRERPDLFPHAIYVRSSSFPSGHSMLSAVTYLTLGAVLASVQSRRILKLYVIALAGILTLLVGFSRVYLGVHWPSDVLAGWAAGVVWAVAVWLITRRLQRKRTIEPQPVEKS